VIYLHNHPFASLHLMHRLKDADDFLLVVRDRADILLFGHNHRGLDFSSESRKHGIPLTLDAGSSTGKSHIDRHLRYRVIDPETLTYQVRMIPIGD
jgi:predicted phosphodiesterase